MIFFFNSIDMIYYINFRFSTNLAFLGQIPLVIACDPFHMLQDLACEYIVENFASIFVRDFGLYFFCDFFFLASLSG